LIPVRKALLGPCEECVHSDARVLSQVLWVGSVTGRHVSGATPLDTSGLILITPLYEQFSTQSTEGRRNRARGCLAHGKEANVLINDTSIPNSTLHNWRQKMD